MKLPTPIFPLSDASHTTFPCACLAVPRLNHGQCSPCLRAEHMKLPTSENPHTAAIQGRDAAVQEDGPPSPVDQQLDASKSCKPAT